ncbi:short chain dehydrogenase, putative [Bodo saltans]|uniref:Short chain dehydrogenase, putative n=1 Tax=Bodo saltans TaxID=75058 RepID=A0A0S4JCK7_BODSA|nr:short chain dehydrogenase, putative [Bodo saltans]|eukprot:CUG89275.1 short chain dehydrogenase, putative [Bodo saltans]
MPAKEIVLITGANKGIGLETARQLGQRGFKVLLGARDAALGAKAAESLQAAGLDVQAIAINVVDVASITAAAAQVERDFGRLDVLVNNAGVATNHAKPAELSGDEARGDFEVNFFGVINVTHAFIPLLRKAELPRIVNLSSMLGSHTLHADPTSPIYGYTVTAYNASKAALNLYTQNLAHALKDEKFKINAAHPGYVKTDLAPDGVMTVEQGAETSVYLATLGSDGPTGGFFHKRDALPW